MGIRLSAKNAQDYLVNITVDGLSYAQEDVADQLLNSFFRI